MSRQRLTNEQRRRLVAWAAEGLSLGEINKITEAEDPPWSVTRNSLYTIRKKQAKRYVDLREAFEREATEEGLSRKAVRIRKLSGLVEKMVEVIEERGKAEYMQDIAGGKTGILVRDFKGQTMEPVYKFDASLMKEIRDYLKQIAIEKGDWTERREITGQIDVTKLSDQELEELVKNES